MDDSFEGGYDIKKEILSNINEKKNRLSIFIRKTVIEQLNKDGVVIGISGGVDSAVVTALTIDAFSPERILGLILPEKESSPYSRELAIAFCRRLKIPYKEISISPILESFNVYRKKELIIQEIFPHYDPKYHTTSLTLPTGIGSDKMLAIPYLNLLKDMETISKKRLSAPQYLNLISLQNVKQRTRMIIEYMYAEKMNYAVCGTTNKTELLTGYYVKYGDGGVDLEPIANCYKLQVFKLAELLNIDEGIISRLPSPDTWSHFISDEDFYLRMPYEILDQLLYAEETHLSSEIVQKNLKMDKIQIEWAQQHIRRMKNAARILQLSPPICP